MPRILFRLVGVFLIILLYVIIKCECILHKIMKVRASHRNGNRIDFIGAGKWHALYILHCKDIKQLRCTYCAFHFIDDKIVGRSDGCAIVATFFSRTTKMYS